MGRLTTNLLVKRKDQIYMIKELKNIIEECDKIIADLKLILNKDVNIKVGKVIFELNEDRVIKVKFLDLNNKETLIVDNTEFFNKVDSIKCGKIEKVNDSVKFYLPDGRYDELDDVYKIDNRLYVGFKDNVKLVHIGFKDKDDKIISHRVFALTKDVYWMFVVSDGQDEYIKFKVIETINKLEKENRTIKDIILNILSIKGVELC